MKYKIDLPSPGYVGDAVLHDTFVANVKPGRERVWHYYGPDLPSSSAAFNAMPHDRLIFRKPDGGFIVMPNIRKNDSFWRKAE